jgi:hypothetical protein
MPTRMKPRDGLVLAAIVGALALLFVVTRHGRWERVAPGSLEYAAYIESYVAECLEKGWVREPPDRPRRSPQEREAACRTFVLDADRFNPGARPLKTR